MTQENLLYYVGFSGLLRSKYGDAHVNSYVPFKLNPIFFANMVLVTHGLYLPPLANKIYLKIREVLFFVSKNPVLLILNVIPLNPLWCEIILNVRLDNSSVHFHNNIVVLNQVCEVFSSQADMRLLRPVKLEVDCDLSSRYWINN